MQVSQLRRSEARMRSDLTFAQDRTEALTSDLQAANNALSEYRSDANADAAYRVRSSAAEHGGGTATALAIVSSENAGEHERRRQQDAMARLVERAEKAEVELGSAQSDIAALRDKLRTSHGAQARGAGAVVSASKARYPRRCLCMMRDDKWNKQAHLTAKPVFNIHTLALRGSQE
jgi:chromosome segregation ATPase